MLSVPAFSQGNWGGGVDDETLHFGFAFQYVNAEYKIIKVPNWNAPIENIDSPGNFESFTAIKSPPNPGFGLGFVSDLYLNKNMNLRFTPTLVFGDRFIRYRFNRTLDNKFEDVVEEQDGASWVEKTVKSTMVEFPLLLKLKSDRRNNFRAYLIGGLKYGIDIASEQKTNDEKKTYFNKMLKNHKNFMSYEMGIGFDLYFEFFKLSPEIKLSNSFKSIVERNDTPYSNALEKLFLRNLIISLYFE